MTLALQAHLFNRLYQTRGTKLKFDTHFLGPAPTGTATIALAPSFGSLGPTTDMGQGMCHDFMGNEIMNNVSQQVMKGENVTQSKELI